MNSHLNVFYHFLSLVFMFAFIVAKLLSRRFMCFQLPLTLSVLTFMLISFLYGCSSTSLILTPNFLKICDQQHHCKGNFKLSASIPNACTYMYAFIKHYAQLTGYPLRAPRGTHPERRTLFPSQLQYVFHHSRRSCRPALSCTERF